MRFGQVGNASEALAYLLDCNLATVEEMSMKKSRSKSGYTRAVAIAQKNFNWALTYGNWNDLETTRAKEIVAKYGNGSNAVENWARDLIVN